MQLLQPPFLLVLDVLLRATLRLPHDLHDEHEEQVASNVLATNGNPINVNNTSFLNIVIPPLQDRLDTI